LGETLDHHALVERTYRYFLARFPPDCGHAIFVDRPSTPRGEKPRTIFGFVPDVLAMDVPATFHAIGEAKTAFDLENDHTRAQLRAYLRHLRLRGGVLVMTVPWTVDATARGMIAVAVTETCATQVETVVLNDGAPWP
jgi:hypothetical protein